MDHLSNQRGKEGARLLIWKTVVPNPVDNPQTYISLKLEAPAEMPWVLSEAAARRILGPDDVSKVTTEPQEVFVALVWPV